jgi:hypothetical protein
MGYGSDAGIFGGNNAIGHEKSSDKAENARFF